MTKVPITLTVNQHEYHLEVEPSRTLLEVLRLDLGLTGTKSNCLQGTCGICTVLVDGMAVNTCIYPILRAADKNITTIEGVANGNKLHILQRAFLEHQAVQCGYCIPGMLLSALALLQENPSPSPAEIQKALEGNLCRCTGYAKIIEAVQAAAVTRQQESEGA
jgi:carbon-monoxide dehydrogenase small subunit